MSKDRKNDKKVVQRFGGNQSKLVKSVTSRDLARMDLSMHYILLRIKYNFVQ